LVKFASTSLEYLEQPDNEREQIKTRMIVW